MVENSDLTWTLAGWSTHSQVRLYIYFKLVNQGSGGKVNYLQLLCNQAALQCIMF